MVFLRNLNVATDELESAHWQPLDFEAVCPDDTTWQLLPFSSLLDQAVENLISTNHTLASSMLREQLNEQCGLWTSLSALQYIYLCKDASLSTAIDSKIFESLDKRGGVWNDRFLLTELVQSAFSETDCVDTSRLIVRSTRKTFHDFENQSRKVKILKLISVDYVLPWPVANIITKPAMSMYQRISTFLMQIRRAKYVLERQRLLKKDDTDDDEDEDDGMGYIIRHNLLWFTNILYGHVTDMVIATNTASMEKTLAESPDIDSMISVHECYMSALEEQCLLSHNLAPIYQAVINLLDLCIHFADIQAARHGEANRYNTSHRSSTALNGQRRHSKRRRHRRRTEDSSDSEDDEGPDEREHDNNEDDDDGNETYYDEGNTTSISFIESSYSHRLEHVMRQFHRLLAFVIAGLRGVGRVDGQQSWDILADRLSWNAQSK
jgi:gamma-tubulin complex component 5